jgi:hypothetical protein
MISIRRMTAGRDELPSLIVLVLVLERCFPAHLMTWGANFYDARQRSWRILSIEHEHDQIESSPYRRLRKVRAAQYIPFSSRDHHAPVFCLSSHVVK